MRIDHGANSIKPHVTNRPAKAASGNANHVVGDTNGSLSSIDVKSIDSLQKLVTNSGEIRESVVNDVKTKIQTGEYLAKQSAVETASAILNL